MKRYLIIYRIGKKKFTIEIDEREDWKALQRFNREYPDAFVLEIKEFYLREISK